MEKIILKFLKKKTQLKKFLKYLKFKSLQLRKSSESQTSGEYKNILINSEMSLEKQKKKIEEKHRN